MVPRRHERFLEPREAASLPPFVVRCGTLHRGLSVLESAIRIAFVAAEDRDGVRHCLRRPTGAGEKTANPKREVVAAVFRPVPQ